MKQSAIDTPTCIDLDTGPGTRALGIETAGYTISAVSTHQPENLATIAANRPEWIRIDDCLPDAVEQLPVLGLTDTTLLSARLPNPCLGPSDARILDPIARAATVLAPQAILLEGVPAMGHSETLTFRRPWTRLTERLAYLGYTLHCTILDGADYGSPSHYKRTVAVALRTPDPEFRWPQPGELITAGTALEPTWTDRGLSPIQAADVTARADAPGPQIVITPQRITNRPYLGPARAAREWNRMGLDHSGIDADGDSATLTGPNGHGPYMTPTQLAALKGIPASWRLDTNRTNGMYQADQAFPPPFAAALAASIAAALSAINAC